MPYPTKKLGEALKKLISILLLGLIFSFVFLFGFFIFNKIFIDQNLDYIDSAIGAFMGAFFAFLFVRMSDGLTKIYERQNRHYNALVVLERMCNCYLNVISNNIFVINDFTTLSKKALEENKPFIYFNVLHEFSLDKEITFNLSNLDLINDVFSFEMGIDKMNNSISATNKFYSEIKSAFIQKDIDFETYKINVDILVSKLLELKAFLLDLERENKEIVARDRILMQDKPFFTSFVHIFSKKRYPIDIESKTLQEIKELDKEIEQVRIVSQAKIGSISKNIFYVLRNQLAHSGRLPIDRDYAEQWMKNLNRDNTDYLKFFDRLTQILVLKTIGIGGEEILRVFNFQKQLDSFLSTGKI